MKSKQNKIEDDRKRVVVLALDGVPYSFLRRIIDDGFMPNLAKLVTTDNFKPMDSVMPPVSSVAWSSFMTGLAPINHRIHGFIERVPQTMEVYVPTADHQRGKTLWEYLSEYDRRVFVMNVPVTYPPRQVNGILIGGFLGTDILKNTYPTVVGRQLLEKDYRIDVDTISAREDLDGFITELDYVYEKRVETLWDFFFHESWDFFIAHIMETDRLHHFLWEHMQDNDRRYTDFFYSIYRKIDQLIGRLVENLADNTHLIILSDHGFTTLKKEVFINKWLYDQGWLKFAGTEPPDSLHHIHPDSLAYSLIPGRIYLNLNRREKNGRILPGIEYEKYREELKDTLMQMVDDTDGERVIEAVYRTEELYAGLKDRIIIDPEQKTDSTHPHYLSPDLVIQPREGYDFKGNLWRHNLTEKGPIVGTHTFNDAFLLVKDRTLQDKSFSIVDMMPTIFDLLQIPIPENLDGKSVLDRQKAKG